MNEKNTSLTVLFFCIIINGTVLYLNDYYRIHMTYYTEIPLIIFVILINFVMASFVSKQMKIHKSNKLSERNQVQNIEPTSNLLDIINE